jgi:hypothetical protein
MTRIKLLVSFPNSLAFWEMSSLVADCGWWSEDQDFVKFAKGKEVEDIVDGYA